MSALGDLLELMHRAHARPKTLRAVIRHWANNALSKEAAERLRRLEQPGSVSTMHFLGTDAIGEGTVPDTYEVTYRLWGREPGRCWRFEWHDHGRDNVAILNGKRWWGNGFGDGFWTNVRPDGSIADNVGGSLPSSALETIFDPRGLPGAIDLQVDAAVRHAGRAAIEATGKPRSAMRQDRLHMIALGWPYADEVRLLVDAGEGILLRYEMLLDGQPFMLWDVEEIGFGVALADSLFEGPADAQLPKVPSEEEIRRMFEEHRPPPTGPRGQ